MKEFTPFGTRTRFIVLCVVMLCLTSVWSNILTFNFAVICMGHDADDVEHHNSTIHNTNRVFTPTEQTYAISIVALAAIVANFPMIHLINNVGIRTVFGFGGILSAIATLLIPPAIRTGYYYFLALRFLQGIAFAANLPAIGAFCSKWAYYKQSGLFIASTVAYLQIAPGFTNPVSGPICEHFGWPSVFYFHGAVGLVLFFILGLFYRNNPAKHPFVGDIEKNKIQTGKPTTVCKKALRRVPYAAILSTPAIWAIWVAAFGCFLYVNVIFLYSPTYMSKVLGYSVSHSGLTAALAPLAQAFMKISVGGIGDRIKFLTEANKVRLFNSVAFFGSATFLILLTLVDTSHSTICVLLFGAAGGIIGANTGGFFRAAPILSKQYSHFVTGNISLAITITMLIVPLFMHVMVVENSAHEWNRVFIILAGCVAVSNVLFCVFVRGEACEWTQTSYASKSTVSPESQLDVVKKQTTVSEAQEIY